MTQEFHGKCHCGAVRFSYQGEAISQGIRCNCSICIRKGAMMSTESIAAEKIMIDIEAGALGLYEYGTKTAKHYFCKRCGIYPFHQSRSQPGDYRVNLGCLEGVDPFKLEEIFFDGKNLF
ncbi:MAG: GFA family protein [SAR324 cluster bacterium]|nr:GFA family protein [SAR324 cluster bacterium]MBL7036075.1 GFA family protein [SAR324 cluster bacterium]